MLSYNDMQYTVTAALVAIGSGITKLNYILTLAIPLVIVSLCLETSNTRIHRFYID